jgi:hypothetical protein
MRVLSPINELPLSVLADEELVPLPNNFVQKLIIPPFGLIGQKY